MSADQVVSALGTAAVRVRLTTAQLYVSAAEVLDIRVMVEGTHPEAVMVTLKEGRLNVRQTLHPLKKVEAVTILLPLDWKGALDAWTLTGRIDVEGFTGTDLALRSVAGQVSLQGADCITVRLSTVFGAIEAASPVCDRLSLRTGFGRIQAAGCSFLEGRLRAIFSRAELETAGFFDSVKGWCLLGHVTLIAPIDQATARLRSVGGKLLTDGVLVAPGGVQVAMVSLTAPLQLISSLDMQADMEESI